MRHPNPKPCPRCGSRHAWLNITIENRTLRRIADSNRGHMLRAFGGAWGFKQELIDRHANEVDRIEIHDRATGTTYHSHIEQWLEDAAVLNLGYGPQRVLPISAMRTDKPTPTPASVSASPFLTPRIDAETVQPILVTSTETTGTIHTPAKSKRPRVHRERRRTWQAL